MKKSLIIFAVVAVVALVAWFYFKPKADETTANILDTDKTKPVAPSTTVEKDPMPLKLGSGSVAGSKANTLVKDVQEALNKKHNAGLVVDGKFGPKTLAVLLAHQYGGVLYWKQYQQVTGKALSTDKPVEIWN